MPNWKKVLVSGSDASLNSIQVTNAVTASEFTGSFTGSALLISASIGHLETIYETASVIYTSGSTKFGDTSDDTHERTGSLLVSGAVTAHSFNISSNAVGTPSIFSDSNINLSASNAVVITSSPLRLASFTNTQTGSITAQVGDIIYNSNTADYKLYSGSWLTILNETSTASLATTASHTAGTASFADTSTSASIADTASYSLTGDGIFSGSFSGSFQGDASALNVNPFPFTGSGEMQGTLTVHSDNSYIDDYAESYFAGIAINSDGDMTVTGSIFSTYINANSFTGSLSGSATSASLAETASYFSGLVTSASFAESSSVTTLATTAITTTGTASIADTATTASHVVTASFADASTTASYGFNMTASSIRVEGTASIVHLESVYETSSIIYSSGSTKFGDDTSDIHERTGSLMTSGSLSVTGSANLIASQSLNNRDSSGLSYWAGSQAQYDALGSYDSNTIYFVT